MLNWSVPSSSGILPTFGKSTGFEVEVQGQLAGLIPDQMFSKPFPGQTVEEKRNVTFFEKNFSDSQVLEP
jgi:hypothetical protein